ncbi:MAG: hypothetical protein HOQ24_01285 [Mycobacteriaceae bacterium]|nr:hypothetical protein [Mycobacteriaceae bacterium]
MAGDKDVWQQISNVVRGGTVEIGEHTARDAARAAYAAALRLRAIKPMDMRISAANFGTQAGNVLRDDFVAETKQLNKVLDKLIKNIEHMGEMFMAAGGLYAGSEAGSAAAFKKLGSGAGAHAWLDKLVKRYSGGDHPADNTAKTFADDHDAGRQDKPLDLGKSKKGLDSQAPTELPPDKGMDIQKFVDIGKNIYPDPVQWDSMKWLSLARGIELMVNDFGTDVKKPFGEWKSDHGKASAKNAVESFTESLNTVAIRASAMGQTLAYTNGWLEGTKLCMPSSTEVANKIQNMGQGIGRLLSGHLDETFETIGHGEHTLNWIRDHYEMYYRKPFMATKIPQIPAVKVTQPTGPIVKQKNPGPGGTTKSANPKGQNPKGKNEKNDPKKHVPKEIRPGVDALDKGAENVKDGIDKVNKGKERIDKARTAIGTARDRIANAKAAIAQAYADYRAGRITQEEATKRILAANTQITAAKNAIVTARKEIQAGRTEIKKGVAEINTGDRMIKAATEHLRDVEKKAPKDVDKAAEKAIKEAEKVNAGRDKALKLATETETSAKELDAKAAEQIKAAGDTDAPQPLVTDSSVKPGAGDPNQPGATGTTTPGGTGTTTPGQTGATTPGQTGATAQNAGSQQSGANGMQQVAGILQQVGGFVQQAGQGVQGLIQAGIASGLPQTLDNLVKHGTEAIDQALHPGGGGGGSGGGGPTGPGAPDQTRVYPASLFPRVEGVPAEGVRVGGPQPGQQPMGGTPGAPSNAAGAGHGQGQGQDHKRPKYLNNLQHLDEVLDDTPTVYKPVIDR